jgi:hypothetical protein
MNAKRTRKAKAGKMAKKHKSKQVSKKTYGRIRLLSVAALVFCAVMAIVVDASDQSTARAVASASKPATVAPITSTPGSKPIPDSTYVGCLRAEDGGKKFILTDIGGPDAPRSRNWKTMFVTKKAGKLEVTPVGSLKLRSHVDQTVRITGKRNDKAFAARTLKVVGSTCN